MDGLGNKKIMAKNIKNQMELTKNSRNDICNALNISYSTFSDWVNANAYPRIDKIEMMANYFGIQKSDLIEDKSSSQWLEDNTIPYKPGKRLPVVGSIKAGYNGIAMEDIEGYDYANVGKADEYIFLRVKGNSMEPRIFNDDLVLIHKQPDVESGDIAAVILNGNEGTLKKIIKQGNSIILQAFNPSYTPQIISGYELENFIIVGKAIEVKRKL